MPSLDPGPGNADRARVIVSGREHRVPRGTKTVSGANADGCTLARWRKTGAGGPNTQILKQLLGAAHRYSDPIPRSRPAARIHRVQRLHVDHTS